MRYDISTSDWESQTFDTLEGPELTEEAWNALWKKAVEEAAELCYNEFETVYKDWLVEKAVEVLINKYGFKRSEGERTKHFGFAGVELEDIHELGEYIPKHYFPKKRIVR